MNKKGMVRCLWVIFTLCMLSSCKVKFDIPEKKMVSILVDIHMADGIMGTRQVFDRSDVIDSAQIYAPIVVKHGYTLDNFRSALNQYMKNPKAFESVYDKVLKQLKQLQEPYAYAANISGRDEELGENSTLEPMENYLYYRISVAGDTAMVWW